MFARLHIFEYKFNILYFKNSGPSVIITTAVGLVGILVVTGGSGWTFGRSGEVTVNGPVHISGFIALGSY